MYAMYTFISTTDYEWRTDKEIIIVTEPAFVGQTIIFSFIKSPYLYTYVLHLKGTRARKTLTKFLDLNGKY